MKGEVKFRHIGSGEIGQKIKALAWKWKSQIQSTSTNWWIDKRKKEIVGGGGGGDCKNNY